MDKWKVGEIAGQVWRAMEHKSDISVQELARILSLNVIDVAMAIGWLAREDKIFIRTTNNITLVSLYDIFDKTPGPGKNTIG